VSNHEIDLEQQFWCIRKLSNGKWSINRFKGGWSFG
jgi:hypothetical protein